MSCGVKRRRSFSLESTDVERQQQILLDLSVMKLHQEQGRHGMEPRLLRFVLINNALRALQGHMLQFEDRLIFSDDVHEGFLNNTFKHGSLTPPVSPPTPVKMIKLDSGFSEQSPLIAASPIQVCCRLSEEDEEEEGKEKDEGGGGEGDRGGGGGEGDEKSTSSVVVTNQTCLGKHPVSDPAGKMAVEKWAEEDEKPGESKRQCQPHLNGTRLNGTTSLSSSTPCDEDSKIPSAIDFAKVDPTLYDYDTRTNLSLPLSNTVGLGEGSKTPSCALEAVVYQNGDNGLHSSHVSLGGGEGANSNGPSSPEGSEGDFLDDIDHIVSLLMT